jgi:hypothetical protein
VNGESESEAQVESAAEGEQAAVPPRCVWTDARLTACRATFSGGRRQMAILAMVGRKRRAECTPPHIHLGPLACCTPSRAGGPRWSHGALSRPARRARG